MIAILCRWLYSLFFWLALPIIFLRLLWRSRRFPAYRKRWRERLGTIQLPSTIEKPIWLHAVSVGEVVAATPIITMLRRQYPNIMVVVTTMTPTGSMQAMNSLGDQVQHNYLFYDLPCFIRRFLNRVDPQLVIIMETELWPNTLNILHKRQIPVVLANARLSERSYRGYQRFSAMTHTMLQQLAAVVAQSQRDGERYLALGVAPEKLTVGGNTKFDMTVDSALPEQGKQLRQQLGASRLVWIAASTHEGEEEQVLQAFAQVKVAWPQALLLLVPRHPDRFQQVKTLCQRQGYCVQTRSARQPCQAETDIFIGDTMGELLLFYAAADVAFVGGSLTEQGGHNMLEPARLAVPIIIGPSLFNFVDISRLLHEGEAAVIVENSEQLAQAVCRLLENDKQRHEYGRRGREIIAAHGGAVMAHQTVIDAFLNRETV